MKTFLKKQHAFIKFLIWILWIPVILFCIQLLISTRNKSIFISVFLAASLFFILFIVIKTSKYLEKEENCKLVIIRQLLYGFLAPFLSIVIFLFLFDKFVQRISVIRELAIIITYLYVTNAFYLSIQIDRQVSKAALRIKEMNWYHAKIVVYQKGAYGAVNLREIALIHQREQINWLITFNEEEHVLDLSLKEITEILGTKQFFKINRSQIVNKDAISKFRSGHFGKVEILLNVNGIEAVISKDRAKNFRKWYYE